MFLFLFTPLTLIMIFKRPMEVVYLKRESEEISTGEFQSKYIYISKKKKNFAVKSICSKSRIIMKTNWIQATGANWTGVLMYIGSLGQSDNWTAAKLLVIRVFDVIRFCVIIIRERIFMYLKYKHWHKYVSISYL